MSADGLVMWLTTTMRVRGVKAARNASTTAASSTIGKGMRARTAVAPARAATAWIVVRVALYS